jgi:Flp pilus assembly protein TadD
VPFDREATLRKAEKLLRQGRLELAVAEYRSVIENQPSDWNTANTLGDLYVRAGQVDNAVAQYVRIADHLATEGFLPKAVATYKKILKIKPNEERALSQLGEIAGKQGLLADAKSAFTTLAEQRRGRGDRRGAAEARMRLGDIEGVDFPSQLAGARARAELGDTAGAAGRMKELADDLQGRGKEADALELLREAVELAPDDLEIRTRLMRAYAARGDLAHARKFATTAAEFKGIAEELFQNGREDDGLDALAAAAGLDPADLSIRAHLAKVYIARGDTAQARGVLSPEVAGSDPELLWTLAEMELRDGNIEQGTSILRDILKTDPARRDTLVILGCSVAESNADAGFWCIEVAACEAIAADEWGSAAAALNEFVNRVPNHIPALMRLVEICVDGGLEATMHSAQTQLADAYLSAGLGAEARVIAEDLVAREPWERANIERFRHALSLLGEADIDTIIAERLSGQTPFTSTDFRWSEPAGSEPVPATSGPVAAESLKASSAAAVPASEPVKPAAPPVPARTAAEAPPTDPPAPVATHTATSRPEKAAGTPPRRERQSDHDVFKLGPNALDLNALLQEAEGPAEDRKGAPRDAPEVDLSEVLLDLKPGDPNAPGPREAERPKDMDGVFKAMRDEAAHDASPEVAEQHLKLAVTYLEMGMMDDAVQAFQVAARSPRHRFQAAGKIARLYLDRGMSPQAIEWLERAAEAPAPDPASAHALLYDLATTLESLGESARALAVLMELQAEAGDYRDVADRLEHLTKVQMGG